MVASNRAEMEMDLSLGSLSCIIDTLSLMDDCHGYGTYSLSTGDLESVLQLDRAALTALNLLPDATAAASTSMHQQPNGSVLEVLNRGKTSMGRRMLERWIRMPLMDAKQISERQDLVELFVDEPTLRMELLDECMKYLPDLEKLAIVLDRQKHVKLETLVSIYDAAKFVLPRILDTLHQHIGPRLRDESTSKTTSMTTTMANTSALCYAAFVAPLEKVASDFQGYTQLMEELVDMTSRLTSSSSSSSSSPSFSSSFVLRVNPKHDEELASIVAQLEDIEEDIQREYRRAQSAFGLAGKMKCEKDKVRGFVFRVINKNEETQLSQRPEVHICQVLVNGLYFTTTTLKSLARTFQEYEADYEARQAHILEAAIQVAATYVPVIEHAAKLLATMDVLLGFAHVASHAQYCRPRVTDRSHHQYPPTDDRTTTSEQHLPIYII